MNSKMIIIFHLGLALLIQAFVFRLTIKTTPCLSQALANPSVHAQCNGPKTSNTYIVFSLVISTLVMLGAYIMHSIRSPKIMLIHALIAGSTMIGGYYAYLKPLLGMVESIPKIMDTPSYQ